MTIDKATEVMAKCFSKSYGAKIHASLCVLDLDPISKIEAYIFLMENPTYKEMFFGCPNHECKCVLLTLMSSSKIKKCGISWPTLDLLYFVILFCFDKTHYKSFFKRYLFAFLDNVYFVENKYVMCELFYNIEIYIT